MLQNVMLKVRPLSTGPTSPTSDQLARALDRGHIHAAFQPKVSLLTGDLIGVEALARWTDRDLGSVPPDVFIPLAERTGQIGRLTVGVLRQSLEACARLRRTHPNATVAVNISPCLLSDPALPDEIAQSLDDASLAPNVLVAEITETGSTSSDSVQVETLSRLQRYGIGCSIDDFGTGYASLLSLLQMPFTELKIDRSFTRACTEGGEAWKIVRATVRLAQELGLRVVAEGIETDEVAHTLIGFGCEIGQGYHFGQPMSCSALLNTALSRRTGVRARRRQAADLARVA